MRILELGVVDGIPDAALQVPRVDAQLSCRSGSHGRKAGESGCEVRVLGEEPEPAGRPGAVLRRGDADAGGVLVVLRGREGVSVLSQVRAGGGEMSWLRATGPGPVDQAIADAYVARQVGRDPDLWVLELEAPDLLPPFEGRII